MADSGPVNEPDKKEVSKFGFKKRVNKQVSRRKQASSSEGYFPFFPICMDATQTRHVAGTRPHC